MAESWASNPPFIAAPRRPFALPRAAPLAPPRAAPPPRRFGQCSAIHRNSQAAWEHDSQGLGIRFPRAGNMIPKGWEHDSQRLGILFSVCRKILHALVHRVSALGTSSASRGYIECRPLVHRVPAAGTSIASRWQFNCRPRAMRLPALGNAIAKPGGNRFAGSRGHSKVMSVRPATPVCGGCPLRD